MSANGTPVKSPTYFDFNPIANRQVTGGKMIGLGFIPKAEILASLSYHIEAHQNGAGPVSLIQTAREFVTTASADPAKMPPAGTPVFGLAVTPAILASCALLELWAARTRIPVFQATAANVLTQPAQQARLAAVDAYENLFTSAWQARSLPDLKGKKENTQRGAQLIPDVESWCGLPYHIAHMSGQRNIPFASRLERMKFWLSNGQYPQEKEDRTTALSLWNRALKDIFGGETPNLFGIYIPGQTADEVPFMGDLPLPTVAYARSTWGLATQMAHRISPVALVHTPRDDKKSDGSDRFTVLTWGDDPDPYLNLHDLKADLQAADKAGGWGGGSSAVGNLNATKLDATTITQMVLARTTYVPAAV